MQKIFLATCKSGQRISTIEKKFKKKLKNDLKIVRLSQDEVSQMSSGYATQENSGDAQQDEVESLISERRKNQQILELNIKRVLEGTTLI